MLHVVYFFEFFGVLLEEEMHLGIDIFCYPPEDIMPFDARTLVGIVGDEKEFRELLGARWVEVGDEIV
jgi:hypothetical protein